jgi:hypothetical protein
VIAFWSTISSGAGCRLGGNGGPSFEGPVLDQPDRCLKKRMKAHGAMQNQKLQGNVGQLGYQLALKTWKQFDDPASGDVPIRTR